MREKLEFKWLAEARSFLEQNGFHYQRIGSCAKYQEHWSKGGRMAHILKSKPGRPRIVEIDSACT